MFREIHTREKITDQVNKELGYLKIRPEVELSDEDIDNFIYEEFRKAAEEAKEDA